MKLYELPRGSFFTIDEGTLLNAGEPEVYFFDHIDGMYSYCKNAENEVFHLAAWTLVKEHKV